MESWLLLPVCLTYDIKSARGNRWLDGAELTLPLTTPVFAGVYAGVTEDPIPIVEENWAHPLDHVASMSPPLDVDVLDDAVTKLGKPEVRKNSIRASRGSLFQPILVV